MVHMQVDDNLVIPRPKITKIPGELPTARNDHYVENLAKLTKVQLLEMKDRQLMLLENKQRIARLPDKGKRIQDFYDKIVAELGQRDEIQQAANLFSELNVASKGQEKLTTLEWTGKLQSDQSEAVLDSDDEEDIDPLKIIAHVNMTNKVMKLIKPEKTLITEEDLQEIESFDRERMNASVASSSGSGDLEPHAVYLLEKNVDHLPTTEKFKPYKTTRSNVHDPNKELSRKHGKNWENTAATPPLLVHPGVKMLSLQESIEVQGEYERRLKVVQEKQAQERLAAKQILPIEPNMILPDEAARKLNQFFRIYREAVDDDDVDTERSEQGELQFSDGDDDDPIVEQT